MGHGRSRHADGGETWRGRSAPMVRNTGRDPRGGAREGLVRGALRRSASATIRMPSTRPRCSFPSWISFRPTIRGCWERSRAIEDELVIDGLVHRFVPADTFGDEPLPLGTFEGAFLPATFWYAHALAGAGWTDRALGVSGVARRSPAARGSSPRRPTRGATGCWETRPLLFSQVEYGRALLAIHENQSKTKRSR